MDPIQTIITALVLGIAAGLKPTAEQVIKDAYSSFKNHLEERYKISVTNLEKKPDDEIRLKIVKDDISESEALRDEELLNKAKVLTKMVEEREPHQFKIVQEQIGGVGNVQEVPRDAAGVSQRQRNGENNTQRITP